MSTFTAMHIAKRTLSAVCAAGLAVAVLGACSSEQDSSAAPKTLDYGVAAPPSPVSEPPSESAPASSEPDAAPAPPPTATVLATATAGAAASVVPSATRKPKKTTAPTPTPAAKPATSAAKPATSAAKPAASATRPAASATRPATSATAAATVGAVTLTIENYAFSATTVQPGQLVNVVNKDAVKHSVTSAGNGIHVEVAAIGTASFVAPSGSGSYPLVCIYHPAMTGTLVVA